MDSAKMIAGRRATAKVCSALAVLVMAGVPAAAFAGPGDLDPAFGGRLHGRVVFDMGVVRDLAIQPDGGVVTVGSRTTATVDAVASRFKPDGRPDGRFGTVKLDSASGDASETARAVAAQRNGKVVVVGTLTDSGASLDWGVWRLNRSGALDTSFGTHGLFRFGNPGLPEVPFDVAVDSLGRILVVGFGFAVGGADPDIVVARLTPTGAPDPTFNGGVPFVLNHAGQDAARALALQRGGKIVISGTFAGIPGDAVLRIDLGDAATPPTLDGTFGPNHDGVASVPGTLTSNRTGVAVTHDGDILLLAQAPSVTGATFDATVVRLHGTGTAPGTVDPTFGSATGAHLVIPGASSTEPSALAVLPSGSVAVVGFDGQHTSFVAMLHPTGTPTAAMGPGGVKTFANEDLVSVAALHDGRIVATGNLGIRNVIYRLSGELKAPTCGGKKATIVGTKAADKLVGTKRPDVIAGLAGRDSISGLGRSDIICGGTGNDQLAGGAGNDHLIGGRGRDTLRGGPGHDTLKQ